MKCEDHHTKKADIGFALKLSLPKQTICLSTNTATPPRGDYVQVSGVLQTGRQCSES